ncbi:hypothetical protein P43SY_009128 [Pythium insidiosum]|uniref:F-box/LRR-repeat protein 15-like leucin rich repeat domain-containing protein n=1 Tax=Pythium insidiosum TaxID=114742 RepID=A0AAD5Q9Y4_PYTIN|nr:hypothetical protein P43SY_009128 [Pythium insidiosum]
MGVATTAYTATVSMKKPKTIKRDDDDLQLGPKERKVMRLTDPSPEHDCAMFDDIATTNQETEMPCPWSQIGRVTADAMEHLRILSQHCNRLQEIHLRDMVVDSAALARLVTRNAETLRVVDLLGCHTITGDDVRQLIKCSRLEELNLWGCHNVENAAIADAVIACPTLRRLNLRYCHKVDDALVRVIAGHLPLLHELNIRYCYKVSDAGVDAITQQLLNLEVLNLSQCNKITDMSITHIVARLKKLKELRLWGCSKLTTSSVVAISEGLPSLALVDIRSQDKCPTTGAV